MSRLTEAEIYARMHQATGEAIDACKNLAVRSEHGRAYSSLRDNLLILEGCCRQMANFRGDTRWLPIGWTMAECQKRAGGWLRHGMIVGVGKEEALISNEHRESNKLFLMLAENLQQFAEMAERLTNGKTDKLGVILPNAPAETRREGRPAFIHRSGLIVPPRLANAG